MTLEQARLLVEVFDVEEDDQYIKISYWKNDIVHKLEIPKNSDDELLQWVDGKVSQYDAINIVTHFEMHQATQKLIKSLFQ